MRTIAHIVKPIAARPDSEQGIAQPITFESMRIAKEFAKHDVHVEQFASFHPEDESCVPEWLTKTKPLTRTVMDTGTFRIPRPLPILKDILDTLYSVSQAEYFIYTNVDISLMPNFYRTVNALIDDGYDAFTINRRTVGTDRTKVSDLPHLYAQIGTPHPGYDTFVFRRDAYPRYILGDVCLGMGHVDLPLIISMISFAKKFTDITNAHLTFHLGDRRSWWSWKYRDYLRHNDREATAALLKLADQAGIRSRIRPHLRFFMACHLLKNPWLVAEWKRIYGFA